MHDRRSPLRLTRGLALGALISLGVAPLAAAAAPAPAETAVFAGGCFWGMEAVFESLRGVTSAIPGYSGGEKATAHYELVSTGTTGHAESVKVTFDPAKISYQRLLEVYFTVAHDPTELDRQGPDDGTQYRSEIFFANEEQHRAAVAAIARYTAEKRFPAPIVTKVEALRAFYPAESYHWHYVALHPDEPYVMFNDLPKLAALKKAFPQLVKPA
jgi:peptide-methionine (S)-S-oxide reductase